VLEIDPKTPRPAASRRRRGWACLASTLALATGCLHVQDPVVADPAELDHRHPAALHEITLDSHGSALNGIVYVAQAEGPHPTVLLLHGLPGNERNLDLAQAVRRAGWNVVFFHYRGAWGSEGEFGFEHALEDVAEAIDDIRQPDFAVKHRIDPSRIALVGHSMGGFMALMVGSEHASVRCIGSLAGANMGTMARASAAPEQAAAVAARIDAWTGPLSGTSGTALIQEAIANADRYDTHDRVRALSDRPVLLVAGQRDESTPISITHDPLVRAFEAIDAPRVTEVVFDADHSFSDHRIALSRAVVDWLERECR
jgi:pimeloyl-ACP methyl ester carboxylesterase